MKNKKRNRVAPFLLSLLLIMQSCQVYKTSSISLEEATLSKEKVKVKTTIGERLKFNEIDKEEGLYYGIKKKKGELEKVPLNQEFIIGVYPKNRPLSTISTIVLPIGIIVGVLLIFQDSFKFKSNTI